MKELWKPVPVEPFGKRYSVSNLGHIRVDHISIYSCNKNEFLKGCANQRGYLQVTLYYEGQAKCLAIHQMVAAAFLGPAPFEGAVVEHKNDCQTDNYAGNLKWGTNKSNAATREAIGKTSRGEGNGRALITEDDVRQIRAAYAAGGISQTTLAHRYGIDQTMISRIVLRKAWAHLA